MNEMLMLSFGELNMRMIVVVLAIALLALALIPAQAELHRSQPQNFIPVEFLAGILGGTVGGFGGAIIASLLAPNPSRECRKDCQECRDGSCHFMCSLCYALVGSEVYSYVFWGATTGILIGTTGGVTIAGSLAGVKGNIPLALVGCAVGKSVSLITAFAIGLSWEEWLTLVPIATVAFASLGATIGYNIGATIESDQAAELAIPLFRVSW